MYTNFIGIDVSKTKIDVFFDATGKHVELPNKKTNLKKAFANVKRKDSFVVLENTGGYENTCVDALCDMGFTIHKTNNNNVKSYIRSLGKKAKTDTIDAKALAKYGKERHEELREYEKPSDTEREIKELALYLEELKRVRAAQKNRAQSGGCANIAKKIQNTIDFLTDLITDIETEIDNMSKKDEKISKKVELMSEYKGVGKTTAVQLLAILPELGNVTSKEIAALAGVAPYARDSGAVKGYRTTKGGGRHAAKRSLFLAALSAIRYNQNICKYYNNLLSKRKRKMVAMVACMRKMIIHLNAILRKGVINDGKSRVDTVR